MHNSNFTAIDFETACHDRASICQIGLVRVEEGEVIEEIDILVQPPRNYYHPIFPPIHGIDSIATAGAPYFNDVWHLIERYINQQTLVAHNFSFDGKCLKAAMERYMMDPVEYEPECTYRIFGKSLNVLCEEHGIPLNHHNALSDARACARLYQLHLNNTK